MKIEGTKEACDFLAAYPRETKRIISNALRYAVSPVAKKVKGAVPGDFPQWKSLVRVKAKQSKLTGRIYAVAGMLDNGQATTPGGISDWYKAYWYNYGTLQRRDPSHKYDRAPRGKKSRNKLGQYPANYYDRAVEGMEADLTDRFLKSIERQHEKLLSKIK